VESSVGPATASDAVMMYVIYNNCTKIEAEAEASILQDLGKYWDNKSQEGNLPASGVEAQSDM
jgi:hypothetical protein